MERIAFTQGLMTYNYDNNAFVNVTLFLSIDGVRGRGGKVLVVNLLHCCLEQYGEY